MQGKKLLFLAYGDSFPLDSGLLMGDPGAMPLVHALVRLCFSGQHAIPRGQLVEGPFR